ncbi:hypothetical protein D3C85_1006170 [compost metagenome]
MEKHGRTHRPRRSAGPGRAQAGARGAGQRLRLHEPPAGQDQLRGEAADRRAAENPHGPRRPLLARPPGHGAAAFREDAARLAACLRRPWRAGKPAGHGDGRGARQRRARHAARAHRDAGPAAHVAEAGRAACRLRRDPARLAAARVADGHAVRPGMAGERLPGSRQGRRLAPLQCGTGRSALGRPAGSAHRRGLRTLEHASGHSGAARAAAALAGPLLRAAHAQRPRATRGAAAPEHGLVLSAP